MKEVIWDQNARKTIQSFSIDVKKELGTLLLPIQQGSTLGMPQSRPVKAVHETAYELRIKDKI